MVKMGVGEQKEMCWISLVTLYTSIGSLDDAARTLGIARSGLKEAPPFGRFIWNL
jgi:hypothetical protein